MINLKRGAGGVRAREEGGKKERRQQKRDTQERQRERAKSSAAPAVRALGEAGGRRQRRAEQQAGQRRAPGRTTTARGRAAAALTHTRRRPGPARTPIGPGPARGDFRGLSLRSGPHTASLRRLLARPEGLRAAPPRCLPQEARMGLAASRPRLRLRPRPPLSPACPTPNRWAGRRRSSSRRAAGLAG